VDVDNGAIKHLAKTKGALQPTASRSADSISSRHAYQNFELACNGRSIPRANSGVKYNVSEQLSTAMEPKHAAKGWSIRSSTTTATRQQDRDASQPDRSMT